MTILGVRSLRAVPITPEGKAELCDEDQTDVLASFTKTQEHNQQYRTEGRKTLPLSSSFHMYKRTRLLDSEQITKLFFIANASMLQIHFSQTCQLLKRRKTFPIYFVVKSKSLLLIKCHLIGANPSLSWFHTNEIFREINNKNWEMNPILYINVQISMSICHVIIVITFTNCVCTISHQLYPNKV